MPYNLHYTTLSSPPDNSSLYRIYIVMLLCQDLLMSVEIFFIFTIPRLPSYLRSQRIFYQSMMKFITYAFLVHYNANMKYITFFMFITKFFFLFHVHIFKSFSYSPFYFLSPLYCFISTLNHIQAFDQRFTSF